MKITEPVYKLFWSRHMMASSNGNICRVTGRLWGKSTGHWWIPIAKPVTRSFDIYSYTHEQAIEQTIETPVICDAPILIVTLL